MSEKKDDKILKFPVLKDVSDEYRGMGFILIPEPTRCPECGSREIREITYGLPAEPPDPELFHVGGCVVSDAQWHCSACGHEW